MIDDLVMQLETRFGELESELSDPQVIGDRERFAAASRAYRELEPAAHLAGEYRRASDDLESARELLAEDGEDADLRALIETSRERMSALEEEIRLAMVERDPNDDKNVIVEIQGGAGGEEAGLWAGDLYRMFTRYAEVGREYSALEGPHELGTEWLRSRDDAAGAQELLAEDGDDSELREMLSSSEERLEELGSGRAVREHNRLRGADHAQAERDRRLDAGREVPAPEQGQGDAGAAGATARA